jgi:hypothetical protein
VGFPRQAFTEYQLGKLAPFVGDIDDTSFFMSTAYMYFPFVTAEVKCGKAALDIADRQNAHSITLSVRGVVMSGSLDLQSVRRSCIDKFWPFQFRMITAL